MALYHSQDLGGMGAFESIFKDKATKLFGSGWAWLVYQVAAS
jgi:superoxide dismutase